MTALGDLAKLLRSKNAGPFYLTFDIMFEDKSGYDRACRSRELTAERMSAIYGVPAGEIEVFHYAPAMAIKITMPRRIPSCDVGDTDTHGGQQFAPLVDLPIE